MLEAVFFDFDGVIVDSEPEYLRTELQLARELGFELTAEFQKKYVGYTQKYLWQDLKKIQDIPYTVEELMRLEDERMDAFYEKGAITPMPGVVELIRLLASKGIKCAITTSNSEKNTLNVLRRLGVEGEICFIASACKVAAVKPAPDVFLLALREVGIDKDACIAIDDSEMGILGAKAAGIKAVGYHNASAGRQDLGAADMAVEDLRSLT
jgi:HAD superfamily hydrolase (TIGR01509 family)